MGFGSLLNSSLWNRFPFLRKTLVVSSIGHFNTSVRPGSQYELRFRSTSSLPFSPSVLNRLWQPLIIAQYCLSIICLPELSVCSVGFSLQVSRVSTYWSVTWGSFPTRISRASSLKTTSKLFNNAKLFFFLNSSLVDLLQFGRTPWRSSFCCTGTPRPLQTRTACRFLSLASPSVHPSNVFRSWQPTPVWRFVWISLWGADESLARISKCWNRSFFFSVH